MKRPSPFADRLKAYSAFALGDDDTKSYRGTWRSYFESRNAGSGPDSQIILEIGCFTAEFLTRIALRHPSIGFVGLDWKAKAMFLAAQHVEQSGAANVALLRARAQELPAMFGDGELDEIWLFHPDPFVEANQRAMRLMNGEFLRDAHRLLKPGGRLILKTDHAEYFDWTLQMLADHRQLFRIEIESRDFWNDEAAKKGTIDRAFAGESTLFESRFIRKRQPIMFLMLQKM